MAARSIASLSLSFGLVSIPVKLYSATESSGTVKFNLLTKDGSRVKQQYVSEKDPSVVVPRAEMVKGYEFEKDRYVLFTPDELKAVEESSTHTIDIVAFIPEKAVDPIYYDKAYFIAPDKRGAKPYTLLRAAMRKSGRCALAKWAWKGKQYVVQVRAAEDGLVLQQLLYADEVRSLKDLEIEEIKPSDAEVQLALQLIDQISQDSYEPTQFVDEEKKRILEAIDAKIAGKQVVAVEERETAPGSGQIIDLTEMLRASLVRAGAGGAKRPAATRAPAAEVVTPLASKERKGVKRAAAKTTTAAPAAARLRK
ncbi:Ku protein [Variovorax sp. J2P1-59]|uniref:non-homologous end joining protein Ku n=1 Tax=Variovorax flavidus TaxID=3053501 RepID=UPI0025759D6B|nr:Ku protein [Variovorax sp. J2P1-59]MDM0073947.1 Ku protein [Variovorax sp. J2P1-59]